MANSWTSCSLRVRTHEMTPRFAALWLGRKTQKFSGTNQKPERPLPFGTVLVRHWARSIQPKFRPVRPGKSDHLKGGPIFSKLVRLERTDPLSFGPKFPEILVEWIAPIVPRAQGLFTPFFTFLRAIFSRPFSLSLAPPTICPWVSEDAGYPTLKRLQGKLWSWLGGLPILADRATHLDGSLHLSWTLVSSGHFFLIDTDGSFISH